MDDVITARLWRRIQRDFPDPETAQRVAGLLRQFIGRLGDSTRGGGVERLMATVVLCAEGKLREIYDLIDLGLTDWRDLLMCHEEMAYGDDEAILDRELGPVAPGDDQPVPGGSRGGEPASRKTRKAEARQRRKTTRAGSRQGRRTRGR
ncbi:hypothetical protein ABT354_34525 [Streptomyces sp. NPDC000594]|uniref:hypothetical protein n=1 Tax=Streptomyces sp. NPDC000594 TaxID=3154261 RepID=UPI00331A12D9